MVGFDGAKGFLFGGLMNVYNFGDGSTYPNPRSSAYFEVSGYTGGSKTFVASYDSGRLLPEVRMNLAASYCADNSMEFFGFGGRRTFYDSSMADGFYKYDRATLNIKADFSGKISDHLSWEVGYHFNQFKVKDYHPQDSDQEISLFGLYKAWGIAPSEEVSKEYSSAVRAGLVYDSLTMRVYLQRESWPGRMSSPRRFTGLFGVLPKDPCDAEALYSYNKGGSCLCLPP